MEILRHRITRLVRVFHIQKRKRLSEDNHFPHTYITELHLWTFTNYSAHTIPPFLPNATHSIGFIHYSLHVFSTFPFLSFFLVHGILYFGLLSCKLIFVYQGCIPSIRLSQAFVINEDRHKVGITPFRYAPLSPIIPLTLFHFDTFQSVHIPFVGYE